MKKIITNKKFLIGAFIILVFIPSFILGFHNATLYNPRHGFDGSDHLFYIKYLNKTWQMPSPILLKETHQSPLYYAIGALLMSISGTWKTAQYINTFVLWFIIGLVGLGLWKVFKKIDQVLIGMFALAALPMLNIFPAMITNELLSTLWIISAAVATIFLLSVNTKKELIMYLVWFTISFILGYWTKVSIILIIPTFIVVCIYVFIKKSNLRKQLVVLLLLTITLIGLSIAPIVIRAKKQYSASDIILTLTQKQSIRSDLSFYYRLDWIPKVDMYNTQYYSMLGGAWNSFWTDGHNAITPFVKFHKKSFVLWSLGFILLPLSIYGLIFLYKKNKLISLIINSIGAVMIMVYIYMNINNHYSAARLTYEMAIIILYAFGMAGASINKRLKILIFILLSVQFITMISFYWIQPWWHVTK